VRPDNRSLEDRQSDLTAIRHHTFGFHWLQVYRNKSLTFDSLVWGALQSGRWGALDHLAGAAALEGGVQFKRIYGKPWLRLGWNYGSGDSSPEDGDHSTFNPMLRATRRYSQLPVYTPMNTSDFFVQVIWKPARRVTLRSDLHLIYLAEKEDLYYFGGGPSRSSVFGFNGLPSGGDREVGTILDFTLGSTITDYLLLELYYGHLFGSDVIDNNFASSDIDYGYAQFTLRY